MTRFLLGVVVGFLVAVFGAPPLIEWIDRSYPQG